MQATVFRTDSDERSGSVLLDDGQELAFDEAALAAGDMRLARPGQRVHLETGENGQVVRVRLAR